MTGELILAGEVWLVGAGPGDPDLLTRKAERLIRSAEIIFHDALVGPDVLDLAAPGTELVSVGKRSGRHSVGQDGICKLLARAARQGRRIVRLKGGDPSMFGRSAEEASYLRERGIRVQVCPGITAASAAVASAGCSLTARGLSQRVQFVTARSASDAERQVDWEAVAAGSSTLAVYMGRAAAGDLATQLIGRGVRPDMPVLIAVDVSLPTERLLRTRLDLLGLATASLAAEQPVVFVIGQVVSAPERPLTDALQPMQQSA